MPKMHGESAKDYAARRAFEAERKLHVYTPGPPIEIPILCTCFSWRYPHELSAHKKLGADYRWPSFEEREAREQNWREYDTSLR